MEKYTIISMWHKAFKPEVTKRPNPNFKLKHPTSLLQEQRQHLAVASPLGPQKRPATQKRRIINAWEFIFGALPTTWKSSDVRYVRELAKGGVYISIATWTLAASPKPSSPRVRV